MERPWRHAVYWLSPHVLPNLLSYSTKTHQPRNGNVHSEGGPQFCLHTNFLGAFSQLEFPLPKLQLMST